MVALFIECNVFWNQAIYSVSGERQTGQTKSLVFESIFSPSIYCSFSSIILSQYSLKQDSCIAWLQAFSVITGVWESTKLFKQIGQSPTINFLSAQTCDAFYSIGKQRTQVGQWNNDSRPPTWHALHPSQWNTLRSIPSSSYSVQMLQ